MSTGHEPAHWLTDEQLIAPLVGEIAVLVVETLRANYRMLTPMTSQPLDTPAPERPTTTETPVGINIEALTRDITSKTTRAELIEMVEAERYRNGHVHIEYAKMDGYSKGMEDKVRKLELELKDAKKEFEHKQSQASRYLEENTQLYDAIFKYNTKGAWHRFWNNLLP